MKLRTIVRAVALAGAAVLLAGQAAPNWTTTVAETDLGHRVGNPAAKVKVVEFFSYTCPHCAEFAEQGEAALKATYLPQGQVSVEYRHLIRDPIDLTAGLLATCGAPAKFPGNYAAFILTQGQWIGPLARPTAAQVARWRAAGAAGRRAIATDFGFYPIMQRRGYTRAQADQCLADEAAARKLAEVSDKEWDRPGIDSTPSFSINGLVMPGTHTWPTLEGQIKDFL